MKKTSPEYFWPFLIILSVYFASGQSQVATPNFGFSIDKIGHFAVFGMLATSIIRLNPFSKIGLKGAFLVWMLVSLYGALDEFRQSFTPGRAVEFDDWLADSLGAATAVLLYRNWAWYRQILEMKPKELIRRPS